jgi:hypothetical protein
MAPGAQVVKQVAGAHHPILSHLQVKVASIDDWRVQPVGDGATWLICNKAMDLSYWSHLTNPLVEPVTH